MPSPIILASARKSLKRKVFGRFSRGLVCAAHLDPETVANLAALAARAKLTIPDLGRAYSETEEMVVELYARHQGVFGELEFIGGDDYKAALDWIRSAKCTFIENYEKELHTHWTDARPMDCSNNLLKMP
jgi:hypothetical protein